MQSHSLLIFVPSLIEVNVTDSLTLTDGTALITATVPMTDTVTLTEAFSLHLTLTDIIDLTDTLAALTGELYPTDTILLVDVTSRKQGEISIDAIALPHVLSISIQEPSIIQDLPIMDALPYRKQRGKEGRRLTVNGWTDSLSTLETLRGYADGQTHLLLLPTGDSMNVHVTDVRTPENVEKYDRYEYGLGALEVVD